jgi:hypothetical protein
VDRNVHNIFRIAALIGLWAIGAVEAFVSVLETVRKTCATRISDALCSLLAGTQAAVPT